ncbi:MAG: putative Transposon Ty3-G Gag-Pol polyprotein [Streblomastix strix]|uniref:Putative Transposon Ty3-G Gag-Pol polyprotein n=1 Tax=Streblomastix strix TaxID=222440 RepID=A0A5J4UT26_9EUKA|nr:MAG: putative Transposon Ty3-G Gag-Pol polyprotein [Streblomastix strix]
MIIPFRGTQEEKKAYQEMLKEQLEEGIVIPIQQDQVKWWNHTFLIKKPNGTWSKILDASKLNKEIEKLHFKMHGLEEVQYLANQLDYATSLDLKSAFHHITVSPNSIPYLAFNFNNNNYAYKAMPFGTKHSPIFFAEAIESILRQIRIHSQVKILNYCDDILLIHQDKQILKTETMEIVRTLEQFVWIISTDKCEIEPKQIITFLGWIWNLKETNIRMSDERMLKMLLALKDWCNTIYKSKNVKIRQLAALIGRLNFLRSQIKEESLYLTELDKAKNTSVKDGIMGWNNDSKQSNNKEIEMVDKENRGQPTRIVDQQNNNMHVNDRCISIELGSDTNIREPDRTDTTRLLEQERSRNDKQCQRNKSYLLRATSFRANLQEDARSGNFDMFRQHNSSIRYWEMESEGIPDRNNKTSVLSGEMTQTTDHNNSHPRKTELNNRFTLETMQIRRLHAEGRNNLNDLQDMELHAGNRYIRKTIQQTNQQLCFSGSKRSGDAFPQRIQLQIEQRFARNEVARNKQLLFLQHCLSFLLLSCSNSPVVSVLSGSRILVLLPSTMEIRLSSTCMLLFH